MRRRAVILASAASAAAILGGWQLGAGATGTAGPAVTATGAAAPADPNPAAVAADGTYTGTAVPTRFGDVQVQVTVSGGTITDVTAVHLTDHDGRSLQISNRAAPVLRDEVLQAQSASVSMVSGATYTSAAYLESLQSALDQAGFR